MSQIIVNPAAGANSPCDGWARRASVNETFATLRSNGANSAGFDSTSTNTVAIVQASATTNQFQQLIRFGFNFDTSALTSNAVISAAKISLWISAKNHNLGDDSYVIVGFTPSSLTQFRTTEYGQLGSIGFCTPVGYSSIITGAYNDFVLDSNGIATISKTGISSFGLRSEWDRSGTFGGTWVSNATSDITVNMADSAHPPKLTVDYTIVTPPAFIPNMSMLGVG